MTPQTLNPPDGLLPGMSFDEYLGLDAISQTVLKKHRVSMAHVRSAELEPFEPSDEMRLGTAIHTAMLTPERMLDEVICYEGRRAGKDWQEFQAKHATKTILTKPYYERFQSAVAATRGDLNVHAARLLAMQTEVSAIRTYHSVDGIVRVRGRADAIGDGVIVDVKSVNTNTFQRCAQDPQRWWYHVQDLGYDFQAGAYCELFRAERFLLLFLESTKPHCTALVELDAHLIESGRQEFQQAIGRYLECRSRESWPGPFLEKVDLAMPGQDSLIVNGDTVAI